jgi:hypothetical protein
VSTLKKKPSDNRTFSDGLNPYVVLAIALGVAIVVGYFLYPRHMVPLADLVWDRPLDGAGAGQLVLTDVNNDGVVDVLAGTGRAWADPPTGALMAMDGQTGDTLWRAVFPGVIDGTPLLLDITGDGDSEVIVSGHFADLYALNRRTGDILWQLSHQPSNVIHWPCQFHSPVMVPDQDNDGVPDIATIQSGLLENNPYIQIKRLDLLKSNPVYYHRADIESLIQTMVATTRYPMLQWQVCQGGSCRIQSFPRSWVDTEVFESYFPRLLGNQVGPGGRLYVISSRTGRIIRWFPVPESRESRGAPVVVSHAGRTMVIYGSGGIRKNGFLQAQDVGSGDILWQHSFNKKGVLSSPIQWVDGDDRWVVAAGMNGEVLKVNARTGQMAWRVSLGDDYETLATPAIIYRHNRPHVAVLFSRGEFPRYQSSVLFVLDGARGEVVFRQKMGDCYATASPLIVDVDGDRRDDILQVTCTDRRAKIMILDHDYQSIFSHPLSSGSVSSPLILDIDQDGHRDLFISRFHYITRFRFREASP